MKAKLLKHIGKVREMTRFCPFLTLSLLQKPCKNPVPNKSLIDFSLVDKNLNFKLTILCLTNYNQNVTSMYRKEVLVQ